MPGQASHLGTPPRKPSEKQEALAARRRVLFKVGNKRKRLAIESGSRIVAAKPPGRRLAELAAKELIRWAKLQRPVANIMCIAGNEVNSPLGNPAKCLLLRRLTKGAGERVRRNL